MKEYDIMATWLIQSQTLVDIADAIRAKTGSSADIQVSDLATEIANIPTGGDPFTIIKIDQLGPDFIIAQ